MDYLRYHPQDYLLSISNTLIFALVLRVIANTVFSQYGIEFRCNFSSHDQGEALL